MFDIFEQPWTLLGAAIITLFGVLTFRSIFPDKQRWWQLALPVFIALTAFGLDLIVATDLERINSVVKKGMKAVEEENCRAIEEIISDQYRDSHHDSKASLMAHCRAELGQPCVEENRKLAVLVELSPPKATVTVSLLMKFDRNSRIAQNYKRYVLVKARLYLQKHRDKRWLIHQVELLELDKQPAGWRQGASARA